MKSIQSAERVSQNDPSDNYVFQRSLLAYHKAAEMVSGNVLEIGTGSGYGVSVISPHTTGFVTIDKTPPPFDLSSRYANVEFHQMTVPPIAGIESASFDFVISFQVIEHVKNDLELVDEIHRVLKPDGKLIITTPNKEMSLTRNPWHVREYTSDELINLLESRFHAVETFGVFGNEKVSTYYRANRKAVRKITRYDILKLQYRLPRWCLRVPYDILNRMNRHKLLAANQELTSSITMDDYRLGPVAPGCYDLFFVATK